MFLVKQKNHELGTCTWKHYEVSYNFIFSFIRRNIFKNSLIILKAFHQYTVNEKEPTQNRNIILYFEITWLLADVGRLKNVNINMAMDIHYIQCFLLNLLMDDQFFFSFFFHNISRIM